MRLYAVACIVVALLAQSCSRSSGLPAVGSDAYRQLCAAFYLGLSALQSGEDVNARRGLTRSTELAAGEPAGWANLGLLQFRQQDYDGAFQSVQKAQALAPANSRLEALLGVIESRRGKLAEALTHLQRAVSLDSGNLKALYGLAQETERQNSPGTDQAAQELLQKILRAQPNNIAVLIDVARLAAKRNDARAVQESIASLRKAAGSWPEAAIRQLSALEAQSAQSNVHGAAVQVQFLRNVLVRVPAYRQSLDEVKTPVTSAGEPFLKFLKLPSPSSDPSPSDLNLKFSPSALASAAGHSPLWIGSFVPDDKMAAVALWADGSGIHGPRGVLAALPRGTASSAPLAPNAILAADLNYDFKTDLTLATAAGLRLYQQEDPDHFTDVTVKAHLPPAIIQGQYTGAWAFDFDLDGDLDVVLGTAQGEPIVLRNNGDGTFKPVQPFHGVHGLLDFASADVDGDGDPDVALLDGEGRLQVLANDRLGDFRLRPQDDHSPGKYLQVTAADVNGDGLPDYVLLRQDLHVLRVSDRSNGKTLESAELVTLASEAGATQPRLTLADLDNNGGMDVVVGRQVALSDAGGFRRLQSRLPVPCSTVADTKANGTLQLLGVSSEGVVEVAVSGQKQYHWQEIRPRAATTSGDQRINSFGIGGEIEIRADLLTQKQIITAPLLHFGLGEHSGAEFARIVWPNGLIQTEFALQANYTLLAEQRLKGSCPLLYAWDGKKPQFVKDVAPMSAALGAHDGQGEIADVQQTEEWFKIDGEQLRPHNGGYDLRVTDEYWESYFIDRYELRAIDHPQGTYIFADERVATPPAPLKLYVTSKPQPFAAARDEQGRDVSGLVAERDQRYLDTFSLGTYQGLAADHWVDLELPLHARDTKELYLIAQGWLHPWDDGNLVAASQGEHAKPQDLSLEVQDPNGQWTVAARNLGVPAGRNKTIVLNLSELLWHKAARRIRLRTNLEVYWDQLQWAAGVSHDLVKTSRLPLEAAALEHRGISQASGGQRRPETPDYGTLAASGETWAPIEGYYTRYGDVLPLLEKSDDRYVIAGSGDEVRMIFKAAPPTETGLVRDFILAGDGWLKEGDYNFAHSNTLLPLPYHARTNYKTLPRSLEDDPAFRRHAADWAKYHTRYMAPAHLSAEQRPALKSD